MHGYRKTLKGSHLIFCTMLFLTANVFANPLFSSEAPCQKAWEQMPDKVKQKINLGGLSFEPEKAFITKCQEYQKQLIEGVQKKFSDIQSGAQHEVQKIFLTWLAEKIKDQLLPTLSPEAQSHFDPNSPYVQKKAIEWLHQPGHEISAYINAFISEKAPFLAQIMTTYDDLTGGESATILKEMKGVLNKARGRLEALLEAEKEIEEKPDVPYSKILKKYGFSGEWLDRFKGYEHKIRSFNTKYNAQEILTTTVAAFQTNDPKEKISGMLSLMDSLSSVASNSRIPMVALMGDIINGMVKVSQEMLKAVLNLKEVLKKRSGFCIGTGPAGDDLRSQQLQSQGILACPLAYHTLPLKDIYETVLPTQGNLLFWVGDHFIEGRVEGGSKAGLNQALILMIAAKELGYAVETEDINTIAKVYNTPGGIPKLMAQARETIQGIKKRQTC